MRFGWRVYIKMAPSSENYSGNSVDSIEETFEMMYTFAIGCFLYGLAVAVYPPSRQVNIQNDFQGQYKDVQQTGFGSISNRLQGAVVSRNQDDTPMTGMPYEFAYTVRDDDGNSQRRQEVADEQGVVTGVYEILSVDGLRRLVHYIADENGFRARIETNEPGTANQNPADVEITAEESPLGQNIQNQGYQTSGQQRRGQVSQKYDQRISSQTGNQATGKTTQQNYFQANDEATQLGNTDRIDHRNDRIFGHSRNQFGYGQGNNGQTEGTDQQSYGQTRNGFTLGTNLQQGYGLSRNAQQTARGNSYRQVGGDAVSTGQKHSYGSAVTSSSSSGLRIGQQKQQQQQQHHYGPANDDNNNNSLGRQQAFVENTNRVTYESSGY